MRRTNLGREGTMVLPSEEVLKDRVAALEGRRYPQKLWKRLWISPF
jgi:hypothetical protein